MILEPLMIDPVPITFGVNLRQVADKMAIQMCGYDIPVVVVDGLDGVYLDMT
jgi:hypothetical protein